MSHTHSTPHKKPSTPSKRSLKNSLPTGSIESGFVLTQEHQAAAENSLYSVLADLDFGNFSVFKDITPRSEEHWFSSQQRKERLAQQVEEGLQRFSLESIFGVMGVPVESSSLQQWLFPLLAYSVQTYLGQGCVHVFQCKSLPKGGSVLKRLGSTALAVDAPTLCPEGCLSLEDAKHPVVRFLREAKAIGASQAKGKVIRFSPKQAWGDALFHSPSTLALGEEGHKWLLQPMFSQQQLVGCWALALPTEPPLEYPRQVKALLAAVASLVGHYGWVERQVNWAKQALAEECELPQLLEIRHGLNESFEQLLAYQHQFLLALSHSVDKRKGVRSGFSLRVAERVRALATALQLNEKTKDVLERAALFTGLYRAFIPTEQLQQQGLWQQDIRKTLKHRLPQQQLRLLTQFSVGLGDALPYLNHQFERWDGSGQPHGLSGWNIPLGSRILALCVAYTARTESRLQRDARYGKEEALAALSQEAGRLWDPYLVEVLKQLKP